MVNSPQLPSIAQGRVRHTRHVPWRHALSFRTNLWLVDVDAALPDGIVASFPTRDHFGGGAPTLRAAATTFAEANGAGIEASDRIIMLAAPRSFGHAFNPLSIFWCLDAAGGLRWVILEIHNTYGGRHAHLVVPDDRGEIGMEKAFYVSPFFTVDGRYRIHLDLRQDRVAVGIALLQQDQTVFSGSFSGRLRPATAANRIRAFLRTPFPAHQTTLRIRAHGIWLWLRRLPVVPRPEPTIQAGMQ